jgi:hypothetical protein
MTGQNEDLNETNAKTRLMWTLAVMLVVVLIIAVLVLRSPISQPIGERTMVPTLATMPSEEDLSVTPEPEVIILGQEDFLDPEEIGHTDGIIFWSTVLMLIVLIGTLRETILRKK